MLYFQNATLGPLPKKAALIEGLGLQERAESEFRSKFVRS